MPLDAESRSLQTAEEIAQFLQVTPRSVYLWAQEGRIPVAYRNGRTIRFRLEDVTAGLNVSSAGDGRYVELVVMALSLVFGPNFPRIAQVDLGSITMDEVAMLKKLCAAYHSDLEHLESPQDCFLYAEGVLAAARITGAEIEAECCLPPHDSSDPHANCLQRYD